MVLMFRFIIKRYLNKTNNIIVNSCSDNNNIITMPNNNNVLNSCDAGNGISNIIQINAENAIQLATDYLRAGEVIAIPTDTVYGLACNANDPVAIQKLYAIKGRNEEKPVSICVSDIANVRHWCEAKHLPNGMIESLLPGAVTILLKKSRWLDNPYLNPGVTNIGVRIPDFNFIRDVARKFAHPIALSSANRSSEKSTLNIIEFKHLWMELGAVFDGGQLGLTEEQRAASTVIDLSNYGYYKITRVGIAIAKTHEIMDKFNFILEK